MIWNTKWFRLHIGRNAARSGNPIGGWFMWRPQPDKIMGRRITPILFRWRLDFWIGFPLIARIRWDFNPGYEFKRGVV